MGEHKRKRISDAETERIVAAMVGSLRAWRTSSNMSKRLGEPAFLAYQRLALKLSPELIRWTVAETNRGIDFADLTLAVATWCSWALATNARNAEDVESAAHNTIEMVSEMVMGFVLNARAVPGAVIDPEQPWTD